MPIKGLTDVQNSNQHGLPEIARLYKGDEKPEDGRRPGKDLTYFRVEFEPQYEELRPLFTELYGDEPTEFEPVFFAGATVDEVFATWKEEWTATALLHRCDGEYQVTHYSPQTGYYSRAKIECATISGDGCACKQTGRLALLLPALIDAAGILGTVSISTHSLNDILTVHRYLSTIQKLHGTLAGVPFRFGRSKRELSAPKTNKAGERTGERMKISKSLFYIHVTADFTQDRLLPALASVIPALPAPVSDEGGSGFVKPHALAKPRRMGGPGEAEIALFSNETHWQDFAAYADRRFGFDEADVIDALAEAVDYPMIAPKDWQGSKEEAVAALVAAHCAYDAAEIERYTSAKFTDPDYGFRIHHLALQIVARIPDVSGKAAGD